MSDHDRLGLPNRIVSLLDNPLDVNRTYERRHRHRSVAGGGRVRHLILCVAAVPVTLILLGLLPASNAASEDAAPGAPLRVTAVAGDGIAVISWLPPTNLGTGNIMFYGVSASPGTRYDTVEGRSNQLTIKGLDNGTAYSFRVRATNATGPGPTSGPSNAVTPFAYAPIGVPVGKSFSAGDVTLVILGAIAAAGAVGGAVVMTRRRSELDGADA